jgi:hypothetical protein
MMSAVGSIMLDLERLVGDVSAGLAKELTIALRNETPKETGHAASNWIPSVGTPYTGIAGSRESVSYSTQNIAIAKVFAKYSIFGGSLYITNNVRYIGALNRGHSGQAPSMFVERTVLTVSRKYRPKPRRLLRRVFSGS